MFIYHLCAQNGTSCGERYCILGFLLELQAPVLRSMDPLPLTTETRAPKLLDLMPLPHILTQLGHNVLDHERFPGAWGEDVFPGLEDELGRGVAGVPLLQGTG